MYGYIVYLFSDSDIFYIINMYVLFRMSRNRIEWGIIMKINNEMFKGSLKFNGCYYGCSFIGWFVRMCKLVVEGGL